MVFVFHDGNGISRTVPHRTALPGELERLDDMVAADLAQCQQELAQLEREVRMLQNGGEGDESDDDEEWSSDEDSEDEADDEVVGGGPTTRMPVPSYLMDGSATAVARATRTPVKSVLQGTPVHVGSISWWGQVGGGR